jgi:hypothetical protein
MKYFVKAKRASHSLIIDADVAVREAGLYKLAYYVEGNGAPKETYLKKANDYNYYLSIPTAVTPYDIIYTLKETFIGPVNVYFFI